MRSPHPWGVALLAVVVVLAGCSTAFRAETPQPPSVEVESSPEATPGSPSPTPSPTPAPASVSPPGVANGTLENETALLAAHVASLRASGYRLEVTDGGSRTTYAAESSFSSFRIAPGANASRPAVWANETATLARLTRDGETVYRRPPRFWASPAQMTGADALRSLFDAGAYARDGTARCGERRCAVLVATDSSRFRNVTAEALVDGEGVVRRFRASYVRSGGNGSTTVEYRHRVTRVGNVTVERPPWVDEAVARSSAG
jgi:hypothetical protein